jgi:hypothetical protein
MTVNLETRHQIKLPSLTTFWNILTTWVTGFEFPMITPETQYYSGELCKTTKGDYHGPSHIARMKNLLDRLGFPIQIYERILKLVHKHDEIRTPCGVGEAESAKLVVNNNLENISSVNQLANYLGVLATIAEPLKKDDEFFNVQQPVADFFFGILKESSDYTLQEFVNRFIAFLGKTQERNSFFQFETLIAHLQIIEVSPLSQDNNFSMSKLREELKITLWANVLDMGHCFVGGFWQDAFALAQEDCGFNENGYAKNLLKFLSIQMNFINSREQELQERYPLLLHGNPIFLPLADLNLKRSKKQAAQLVAFGKHLQEYGNSILSALDSLSSIEASKLAKTEFQKFCRTNKVSL